MKLLLILMTLMTANVSLAEGSQNSITLTEMVETKTAAMRIITTPQNEGPLIREGLPKILAYLRALGVEPNGAPYTRYVEYSASRVEIEIGFPTAKPISGSDEVYASVLPDGKAATLLYVGPYEQIAPAYEKINDWMKEHQHKLRAPTWEVSLNDPRQTTPDRYETLIVFPIH